MPENTIAEKIIKLRCMHNFEREEFSKLLGFHWDTVEGWEFHNIMPKPESILRICKHFKIDLDYFHEYYNIYYNNPSSIIKAWKENKKLTYKQACEILGITHSGFGRLLSGKIHLSYDMYLRLKKLGVL